MLMHDGIGLWSGGGGEGALIAAFVCPDTLTVVQMFAGGQPVYA